MTTTELVMYVVMALNTLLLGVVFGLSRGLNQLQVAIGRLSKDAVINQAENVEVIKSLDRIITKQTFLSEQAIARLPKTRTRKPKAE